MRLQYHIYMDNYYNNVNTAKLLLRNTTKVCGTIRKNRGLPQNLKNIRINEHETKFAGRGQVLLHLWQATKNGLERTISTIHSTEMENLAHWSGTKTKPKSIVEYNKYIQVVDRADTYMSYYSILRETKKWTKKQCFIFSMLLFLIHFS